MSYELDRDEQAYAWELRAAWALGRVLVLSLDERCVIPRVRGTVCRVATTGAFVLMDDGRGDPVHVPCALIRAIRRPHFSEPNDAEPHQLTLDDELPGQLSFEVVT